MQYNVKELPKLLEKLTAEVGVVNGYKLKRQDPLFRVVIGYIYQYVVKFIFQLPIKDVDCDFRLIRKKVIDQIQLTSDSGTICVELIKKIEFAGFKFTEVGVSHYYRAYGSSQFFTFKRIARTLYRLAILWFDLFIFKKRRNKKIKTVFMTRKIINALAANPKIFIWLRRILENNFRNQKKVIRKYFSGQPGENILDIGCGTGEFSIFFNPDSYTGIDIEPAYIAYAKKNYQGKFLIGDAADLPFSDNSFDRAVILGVLHHLNDNLCEKIFKEMKRILKSNADILIMEDVASMNDNIITKKLHSLDKGDYIRRVEEYYGLLRPYFKIEKNFKIKSGLCPYQVFLLKNIK